MSEFTNDSEEEAVAERVRRHGLRRFIWSADREGRFTAVSAPLAEVVGAENAAIVGQRWDELRSGIVIDEAGTIAGCFARRATWSNETVLWRVAGADLVVPVELGGMPVFGRGHELEGYRGFGLCRAGDVRPAPVREIATEEEPATAPMVSADEAVPSETLFPERVEEVENDEQAEAAPAPEVQNEERGAERGEEMAFGPLQARVGAQLGSARPIPLRSLREIAASARPVGGESERDPVGPPDEERPILSVAERGALQEIARALGARLDTGEGDEPASRGSADILSLPTARNGRDPDTVKILDRLPVGVLVLRGEAPIYANRFALELFDFPNVEAIGAAGGVSRLFAGRLGQADRRGEGTGSTALLTRSGGAIEAEVRFTTVEWGDAPASFVMIRPEPRRAGAGGAKQKSSGSPDLDRVLGAAGTTVAVLDAAGRIVTLGGDAERMFGAIDADVAGESVTALLAPESHPAAIDALNAARATAPGVMTVDEQVLGRHRTGATTRLLLRAGRIDDGDEPRYGVLFTGAVATRAVEAELDTARRAAETASTKMSEVLAQVSHEIRTPLNAIIGFAEIMMDERFGPIGNERYKAYLRDIRESGAHVVSLVNDLLDLAKITAGKSELSPGSLDLGAVAAQSLAMLQPAAARERIIMRASYAPDLPRIVADERSVRQITLNLLSNAVRFTRPGGQVIASTGMTDRGEVVLRVRDTGIGMTPDEVRAAMEPFRQVTTGGRRDGTGLGLPLSKALAEANGAKLAIKSEQGRGTLVEVLFRPAETALLYGPRSN